MLLKLPVFVSSEICSYIKLQFQFYKKGIFYYLQYLKFRSLILSMLQERIYSISNLKYPFGHSNTEINTFAQYIQEFKNNYQQKQIQKNLRLFLEINCQNIISLQRISKKEKSYHLFYKYYADSLETWVKKNLLNFSINSQRQIIFNIVSKVISILIEHGIKASFTVQQIGFSNQDELKIFINPQFQITTEFRSLKFHYQKLKKNIDSNFLCIFNQQKRISNLHCHTSVKPKKVVSRNFIIRGNKLVFLDEKRQCRNNKQKQYLWTSFHKSKRDSSSTSNTIPLHFNLIESAKAINLDKVRHKSTRSKGKTQRSNKSVQTLIKTSKPWHKLYESQKYQQKKATTLRITTYHQIQIQAFSKYKTATQIQEQTLTSEQAHTQESNFLAKIQANNIQTTNTAIFQNQQQTICNVMKQNGQKRRLGDISEQFRKTKFKIDLLFKKYEQYLKRNNEDQA